MKHFAAPSFWDNYERLPVNTRNLADQYFNRLKLDIRYPSLHFKKIGIYRSVRVGLNFRALALEIPEGLLWFWIGTHNEYQRMIKGEG